MQNKINESEKISLEKIIDIIDKARRNQLIQKDSSKKGNYYTFIHDKISENLLTQLDEKQKEDLHLSCAMALEEKIQNESEKDHTYELAYHYNNTNHSEKMLYYNTLAYKKAYHQFSLNNTIFYMNKIIHYSMVHNKIDQPLVKLGIRMGELLNIAGKVEKSLEFLKTLLKETKKLNLPKQIIDILIQIGRSYYLKGDNISVTKYYQQAFDLAKKTGIEINKPHPYQLMGSMQWFTFDLENAVYNLSKAIEYLGDDQWSQDNRLPIYGVRGWSYVLRGELDKVRSDVQVIEAGIEKMDNFINQAQTYHALSACCSWSGNPIKGLKYTLKSYEVAFQSENMLFCYSSLFSRVLAYFYQQEYTQAKNAINDALKLSRDHNIIIGISLFHAYHGLIYLHEGKIEKARELYEKHFSEKTERFQSMIFNRIMAAYHFFNEEYEECLRYLDKGLEFYKTTSIVMEGLILLALKQATLKKLNHDSLAVEEKINQIISERRGSEVILERGIHFIKTLVRHRSAIKTMDQSQSYYSQSSSSIKDRLQLENVIKTSQMISSILDINELLNKVIDKTLEVTGAERGALMLYDEKNNNFEYKILRNADKENFKIANKILYQVVQNKKGMVLSSIKEKHPELSDSIIAEDIKSIICVPLSIKEKIIGILYMDSKLLNNLFSQEDLELLSVFTSQAAISIENAQLYEKMLANARVEQEMKFARDIQTSILPVIRDTDDYEISGFMRTATEVGGDYYDLYMKEEPFLGVFGDVSGHGLKSGLMMMMAEVAFNAYTKEKIFREKDIRELYQDINLTLYDNLQERLAEKSELARQYSSMYMTFRLFKFDSGGKFEMFGNDHAEPFIVRKNGGIEELPSTGFLVGIMKEATLNQEKLRFQLNSGDMLVFCSDGLEEAKNNTKKMQTRQKTAGKIHVRCRKNTPAFFR